MKRIPGLFTSGGMYSPFSSMLTTYLKFPYAACLNGFYTAGVGGLGHGHFRQLQINYI